MKLNNLGSSHLLLLFLPFTLDTATASKNTNLQARQQPSTSSTVPVSSSSTTAAAAAAITTPSTLTTSTIPTSPSTPLTSPTTPSLLPGSSPSSRPRNHNIAVGLNGTTFTPSTLKNIPPGDTLTFYFYPTNYSVIQSSFESPCQPISITDSTSGLFSGWFPATPGDPGVARQKFVVNVEGSETMWIYALDGSALESARGSKADGATDTRTGAVRNVCVAGMAMVVNPVLPKERADGRTLSAYRRVAAAMEVEIDSDGVGDGKEGIWRVPGMVSGGEVRGVSEKEKVRWEGKHPDPDGDGDGDGGNGSGSGSGAGTGNGSVDGYRSGAVAVGRLGLGWMMVVWGMGLVMAF